jgi:hypothetical protein
VRPLGVISSASPNPANRIGKGFALGMNFNLRYHREPIGAREPLDTQRQVVAILDHSIEPAAKK